MTTVHSAIARYQRLLGRVGIDEIGQLAYQAGQIYGQPNNPHGGRGRGCCLVKCPGLRSPTGCV